MKGQKWRGKEAEALAMKPAHKSRLLCFSSLKGPTQQVYFEHVHHIRLHRKAGAVTSSQFSIGLKSKLEALLF